MYFSVFQEEEEKKNAPLAPEENDEKYQTSRRGSSTEYSGDIWFERDLPPTTTYNLSSYGPSIFSTTPLRGIFFEEDGEIGVEIEIEGERDKTAGKCR